MASRRLERVGEELRAELARVLRSEVSDPRIGLVTILRVDVSPDLRNALVFWSRIERRGGPSVAEIGAGLASAAPFLRRRLAQELPLKRMPAFDFRYDAALEEGDRTLALLRELESRDDPQG
jgi:ribosome-binding factor A